MRNPENLDQFVRSLDGKSREEKIKALIEYGDDATALGRKERPASAKQFFSAYHNANALIHHLRGGITGSNVSDEILQLRKELDRQIDNPGELDGRLGSRSDD